MDWKIPNTINPSNFSIVSSCPLKLVLKETISISSYKKKFNPNSELGILLHKIDSLIINNSSSQPFDQMYLELVTIMAQKYELNIFEIEKILQNIQFFNIKIALIRKRYENSFANNELIHGGIAEVPISTRCGRIKGVIDYLMMQNDVEIGDLKTGCIDFRRITSHLTKSQYAKQLLLYGASYQDWHSITPKRLFIYDLLGRKTDLSFSTNDLISAKSDAFKLLDRIQSMIEKKTVFQLANPEKCNTCNWRIKCPVYCNKLKSVGFIQISDHIFDYTGIINEIKIFENLKNTRILLSIANDIHKTNRILLETDDSSKFLDLIEVNKLLGKECIFTDCYVKNGCFPILKSGSLPTESIWSS
jgi:hypothetical protein